MKCLVDTSVLIHSLISRPKLNQRALALLADSSSELHLSAVSSWEIIIKVRTGRLFLPERPGEFVTHAMRVMSMRPLDITHLHALAVDELPEHHRDPFDRLLIAQALSEQMTLLTTDRALQKYKVDLFFCGN
ncbi:MAG TPA: type II toxin-antitoxin system VapC family toxin [Candidatus Elarobacter sp.]|nr:type II toxin-antitoxin system VapC family toxin [Candidatus Elarobacter sp.]